MEIQAKFEDCFSIRKFIELKNGDLAVIVWRFGISFYTKKKKKKSKYSLLKKYRENKDVIISDLIELDNNKFIISLKEHEKIQFLDMNFSKITKTMKLDKFCIGSSINELILMNDIDLFVVGEMGIIIIDIQKKEIIKRIQLERYINIASIYKLGHNILLVGYWYNYFEQLEYDETKKVLNLNSMTKRMHYYNNEIYHVNSISIYKNNLIAVPYDNYYYGNSSLIVYKYKFK